MKHIVFISGFLLALSGALALFFGFEISNIERGMSQVIGGTVALSSGLLLCALSLILGRLEALYRLLASSRFSTDSPAFPPFHSPPPSPLLSSAPENSSSSLSSLGERSDSSRDFFKTLPDLMSSPPASPLETPSDLSRSKNEDFLSSSPSSDIEQWDHWLSKLPQEFFSPPPNSKLASSSHESRFQPPPASTSSSPDRLAEPPPPKPPLEDPLLRPFPSSKRIPERSPLPPMEEWPEAPSSPSKNASSSSLQSQDIRLKDPLAESPFLKTRSGPPPSLDSEKKVPPVDPEWFERALAGSDEPLLPGLSLQSPHLSQRPSSESLESRGAPLPVSSSGSSSSSPPFSSDSSPIQLDSKDHSSPSSEIIGSHQTEDASYVMYADGSIEAKTSAGVYRFPSLEALKTYIETQTVPLPFKV